MTSLLKLDKVSKVYGEGNTEVTALHPISLDVKAGESNRRSFRIRKKYVIINRGCTIITVKGDIYIREQNITQLSEKEMTDIRLKNRFHLPVCKPCSIFKCEGTVTLHC